MTLQQIIAQIDDLLREFERARASSRHDDLSGGLPSNELMMIRTRLRAGIERLAPRGSSYLADLATVTGFDGTMILDYAGILSAIKSDYQSGYLRRVEELVHAQVFDDFLEMASEFHGKGYKDAAAVISGTVLEEHTRKLSITATIPILDAKGKPRRFDELTVELVKAQVFSEPQRKILLGWYGQRSEAAHGRYANVIEAEVGRMIDGIRDFLVRFPA